MNLVLLLSIFGLANAGRETLLEALQTPCWVKSNNDWKGELKIQIQSTAQVQLDRCAHWVQLFTRTFLQLEEVLVPFQVLAVRECLLNAKFKKMNQFAVISLLTRSTLDKERILPPALWQLLHVFVKSLLLLKRWWFSACAQLLLTAAQIANATETHIANLSIMELKFGPFVMIVVPTVFMKKVPAWRLSMIILLVFGTIPTRKLLIAEETQTLLLLKWPCTPKLTKIIGTQVIQILTLSLFIYLWEFMVRLKLFKSQMPEKLTTSDLQMENALLIQAIH